MTQEQISAVMNLFSDKGQIVWIADENWNLLSGKHRHLVKNNLPDLLGLPADFWGNTQKAVYIDGHFWDCRIYARETEKCRVLILKPITENSVSQDEVTIINALQILQQTKNHFQEYLDEHELSDDIPLSYIERVNLLLYRRPYLKKMLRSVYSGTIRKNLLSLSAVLQSLKENMQKELKNYAEISLSLCEKTYYLQENQDFFYAVILSGLILCQQERNHSQEIKISLAVSGQKIKISIAVTPDETRPADLSGQLSSENFDDLSEEHQLLDAFCALHEGSWKIMTKSVNNIQTICCQIIFCSAVKTTESELHSPVKVIRPEIENTCRLLLSRVYLSRF